MRRAGTFVIKVQCKRGKNKPSQLKKKTKTFRYRTCTRSSNSRILLKGLYVKVHRVATEQQIIKPTLLRQSSLLNLLQQQINCETRSPGAYV